ncbi:MAG: hypothetical protein H6624_06105 [Bdellovibrionaceae bacterium]|nr:hypothetical protein [Bdellovibrionales bacterium]MCB9083896.1 hypothetical protein [Pseudobdellovibrionaceae bacterium]
MKGIGDIFIGLLLAFAATLPGEWALGDDSAPAERIRYAIETDGGGRIEMDTTVGMALGSSMSATDQAETLEKLRMITQQSGRPLSLYVPDGTSVSVDMEVMLTKANIPYEIVSLPTPQLDLVNQARNTWMGRLKSRMDYVMRAKPSAADWFLGVTMASYSGAAGVWAWAHHGTLDPWTVGALAGYEALIIWLQTTHIHRLDRIFGSSQNGNGDHSKVSGLNQIFRRSFFTLMMTETVRLISGPIGDAHSFFSMTGQAEVLSFVGAYGLGMALFNTVRDQLYSNRPEISRWANFNQFILMTPLTLMDWSGIHLATLFEIGYFHLNLSTTLILAGYAGIAASLKYVKPLRVALESIAKMEEKLFQKGMRRVAKTRATFRKAWACRRFLRDSRSLPPGSSH